MIRHVAHQLMASTGVVPTTQQQLLHPVSPGAAVQQSLPPQQQLQQQALQQQQQQLVEGVFRSAAFSHLSQLGVGDKRPLPGGGGTAALLQQQPQPPQQQPTLQQQQLMKLQEQRSIQQIQQQLMASAPPPLSQPALASPTGVSFVGSQSPASSPPVRKRLKMDVGEQQQQQQLQTEMTASAVGSPPQRQNFGQVGNILMQTAAHIPPAMAAFVGQPTAAAPSAAAASRPPQQRSPGAAGPHAPPNYGGSSPSHSVS